jgi:hypothetical protein
MTLIPRTHKTNGSRGSAARPSAVTWLSWAVCGLVLVLIACAVVLAVPNRYDLWRVDFLVPVASAALVGALIASRQPHNPVGWFILGHAVCFSLGEFGRQYAIYGVLTEPGALPFARVMIWPTYWIWYPGLILMISLLPLYFPDGRLVSRGWRWATRLAVVFCVGATGLAMVRPGDNEAAGIPNPLGIESLSDEGSALSSVFGFVMPAGWLLLGAGAVVSLMVRFWRSRGEERQQLEWFVYAVVLLLLANTVGQLFSTELLPSAIRDFLFVVTLEGLWIAIGIAILRYRLYDIDLIINRTLVYGSLTVTLALVYFAGVTVTQAILRTLRRLMHNRSDQEIREVAQGPAEQGVEPLPERVGCQLGGQAGEQTAQRLRAVALQGEEVLQLRDHLLDDLPLARRPTPILFWPCPPGVVLRGGRHQRSVDLQPTSLPCH